MIDILFDLDGNSHKVSHSELSKNVICVSGSCDLFMQNNGKNKIITLNKPHVTVHIEKDTDIELKNTQKIQGYVFNILAR